eukprot:TRINITY_DN398_c0_g1_i1.p1 TRINITY_DN398_c0_g1~~TRINITY_DN398_c0_g1_i1.p1  ORF type:complete len:316 (+),score=77.11 TRINITY_DN398_c0_g1_i1:110-1057(+)
MLRASAGLLCLSFVQLLSLVFLLAKVVRIPQLASWKHAKLNLTDFNKKTLAVVVVETPLMIAMAILFRGGFGIVTSPQVLHILMNTMLCVLGHTSVFMISSALFVYNAESGVLKRFSFHQAIFERVASCFLIVLAVAVTALVLWSGTFAYQVIWYSFVGSAVLAADIGLVYLQAKVGQSIANMDSEVPSNAANSATSSSPKILQKRQFREGLIGTAISLTNVVAIHVVLVILSATCTATLGDVWNENGSVLSKVPEISTFVVYSSVIFITWMMTLATVQEMRRDNQQQTAQAPGGAPMQSKSNTTDGPKSGAVEV